jgi:hypothetical protein
MVAGADAPWAWSAEAMKVDTSRKATRAQAEAYLRHDDDPILEGMIRDNLPLTRDTYIFLNWDKRPNPWTAEHEEQVPDIFRPVEDQESASTEAPSSSPATTVPKACDELKKSAPCLIIYRGIWVSAPLSDVEMFLDGFRKCTPEQAASIAQAAQHAIDEILLPKLKSKTMSPKEYLAWMENVSI